MMDNGGVRAKKQAPEHLTTNRALVKLTEHRLEAERLKEQAFFDLVERFRANNDPRDVKRLGDRLGRKVFGSRRDQ